MPETVEPCVKLCYDSLHHVESLISKSKKLNSSDMEKALKAFMRSVKLLRDIVMELLQEQQKFQHEQLERIESLRTLAEEDFSYGSKQRHAQVDLLAGELRSMAQNTTPWQPDTSDPFSFSATIIHAHEDDSEHTVARGKLDSGCDENWISTEVLMRAGIEDQVDTIEDSETYTAFGGEEFEPVGKVDITWYAINALKSRGASFLVHPAAPFDMILGRIFIAEESIFMFNKPALALRVAAVGQRGHER
ncbi:hypothetical protein GP486_008311 [Trichoglossum hirsutum]|uniref:Uncharacterized protein n=1 Tax=Trichoglossum hirsutum TaxID=265104 RepID=A0A9P8IA84_9PEZI|nr:hypothetical protein GP486_008311 [Trichoglossum hirsutum]